MVRAAVMTGIDQPLEVRDLQLEPPRSREVLVRLVASGVCHSDLSMRNGTLIAPTPIVLGHEGAGVVEEVGDQVTGVRPGDHVVISWVPQCGSCFFCQKGQPFLCEMATVVLASGGLLDGSTRFEAEGAPVYQMVGAGTFAERTVVPEAALVKVDDDLDLSIAALLGCSVLTGIGAAVATADIYQGDTVAVLGCGGVGLNVIQGAVLAGAGRVIAIDVHPDKLDLARQFGATHVIDGNQDTVSAVMQLSGQRGADVTFEVVGMEATIQAAIAMTRRGGETVVVGVPPMDAMVEVPAFMGLVLAAKTIKGCWYGSADVRETIPRLVELYRQGHLKLDELVSRTIPLDNVNQALDAMQEGEVARSVIRYPG